MGDKAVMLGYDGVHGLESAESDDNRLTAGREHARQMSRRHRASARAVSCAHEMARELSTIEKFHVVA